MAGEVLNNGEVKGRLSREEARLVGENAERAVNEVTQGVLEAMASGSETELGPMSEEYFASGEDLGMSPETARGEDAVTFTEGLFEDVPLFQKIIRGRWNKKKEKMEREASWDNFIGEARDAAKDGYFNWKSDEEREAEQGAKVESEAKEAESKSEAAETSSWDKFIGPALEAKRAGKIDFRSPEEREAWEALPEAERERILSEAWENRKGKEFAKIEAGELKDGVEKEEDKSWDEFAGDAVKAAREGYFKFETPEERAEKEKAVAEKLKGNIGFLRARRRSVAGLAGTMVGVMLFMTSCGAGEKIAEAKPIEMPEDVGSNAESVSASVKDEAKEEVETVDEQAMRDFEAVLALSKDLDFSKITDEQVMTAGQNPNLVAMEQSGEFRVVKMPNGVTMWLGGPGFFSERKTEGPNCFGESLEYAYGDRVATITGMEERYYGSPEELATMTAVYPTVLRRAGVSEETIAIKDIEERAKAIVREMYAREDGGELQVMLRGAFRLALEANKSEFNYYQDHGTEASFYIYLKDGMTIEKLKTIENPEEFLELGVENVQRTGEKQLQIVLHFIDEDGNEYAETGDYNMPCGMQLNLTIEGKIRQPVVVVVEDTEPEPGPKPTSEPTPEPEPEPEPTPEPEPEDSTVVQEKSEEGEIAGAIGGGSNPVNQTENLDAQGTGIKAPSDETPENAIPTDEITGNTTGTYEKTSEPEIPAGIVQGQTQDETVSQEQQELDAAAQARADEAENTENKTPEEQAAMLAAFVNGLE